MHQKHHFRLLILHNLFINNLIIIQNIFIYPQLNFNLTYLILKQTLLQTTLGIIYSPRRQNCLQKHIQLLPTTLIHLKPVIILTLLNHMIQHIICNTGQHLPTQYMVVIAELFEHIHWHFVHNQHVRPYTFILLQEVCYL